MDVIICHYLKKDKLKLKDIYVYILWENPLKLNMGISLEIKCLRVIKMAVRIRELREDNDLKQKDLADYLNIHQTTYSDYERGYLNIPVPVLIKLSHFYKTSIDYLVGQTDDPTPYKRREKQ